MSERALWQEVADEIAASLAERGLDLVHPFQVGWYNRQIPGSPQCLPDLGRTSALGLLVGNTGALWSSLRAAIQTEPELQRARDPIDRYAMDAVVSALSVFDMRWLVRWAHELEPEPLPIQRVAWASGFAMLSPSHLSVHPVHGPWIALRAVAVVDVDGPPGDAPQCQDHCTTCTQPCVDALRRALDGTNQKPGCDEVEQNWESWVSVRDACPIGKSSRYCDEQVRYHYTKLRELLA